MIEIVAEVPSLRFWRYGSAPPDPMPPPPGEGTGYDASVGLDTGTYGSRINRVITDAREQGCVAGRFEVDFDSSLRGRLVGWFRTL